MNSQSRPFSVSGMLHPIIIAVHHLIPGKPDMGERETRRLGCKIKAAPWNPDKARSGKSSAIGARPAGFDSWTVCDKTDCS